MNGKDFQLSRERVVKRANSAADLFKLCTDPKPDGLGIQDSVVLGTSASPVLDEYTKFLNDVAKKENWVKSLVAMIPCVQVRSLLFCIRILTGSRGFSVLFHDRGDTKDGIGLQWSAKIITPSHG